MGPSQLSSLMQGGQGFIPSHSPVIGCELLPDRDVTLCESLQPTGNSQLGPQLVALAPNTHSCWGMGVLVLEGWGWLTTAPATQLFFMACSFVYWSHILINVSLFWKVTVYHSSLWIVVHVKHHASSCVLHSIKCHHPQIRELVIALIVLISYYIQLQVLGVFSLSPLFFFSLSFLFLSFGKAQVLLILLITYKIYLDK